MKHVSSNILIAITVPVIMFGGIILASSLGWWKTAGGNAAPATIKQGDFAGLHDPADIRGSSSLGTIETYFGVPATLIAQAFGIQASNPRIVTAKFVDTLYGEMVGLNGEIIDIGTDAVKLFVARMTGLPYTPEAKTGLPESAIDLLLTLGAGMTEEQRQALLAKTGENRTINFDTTTVTDHDSVSTSLAAAPAGSSSNQTAQNVAPAAATATAPSVAATSAAAAEPSVTHAEGTAKTPTAGTAFVFQGRTTFADVLAVGLTQAQIETVLGKPMGSRTQSIKDFCDSNQLSYGTVRAGLSQLMNQ
jgi:hypothetical protein